ncbi:MAG: hypothetical protein E6G94_00750 [Alphaproteobacteria bacterium]|nr:MAG: hypothetical protein E6G94_00750 [Alphaproteobacteria bacterium]
MADEWQPPTEEEFNHDWLMPATALELIQPAYREEAAAQRWIMSRLKTGVIQAVARTKTSAASG